MSGYVPGVTLYAALRSHYDSQQKEALAVLSLYVSNPLAVSDHSNFLEDMKGATRKLAEADEAIAVLDKYFVVQNPTPPSAPGAPE
jgi:hypothetical protein